MKTIIFALSLFISSTAFAHIPNDVIREKVLAGLSEATISEALWGELKGTEIDKDSLEINFNGEAFSPPVVLAHLMEDGIQRVLEVQFNFSTNTQKFLATCNLKLSRKFATDEDIYVFKIVVYSCEQTNTATNSSRVLRLYLSKEWQRKEKYRFD